MKSNTQPNRPTKVCGVERVDKGVTVGETEVNRQVKAEKAPNKNENEPETKYLIHDDEVPQTRLHR